MKVPHQRKSVNFRFMVAAAYGVISARSSHCSRVPIHSAQPTGHGSQLAVPADHSIKSSFRSSLSSSDILGRTALASLNFLLFRKIVADHNSKYISLYEAAISQDYTTINFTLNLARNITADVWLKATIAQRVSKTGESYRDVFTYNVNLCQVMGRAKGISLINFWLNNILRQSNVPRNCPLREGNYYMRNIRSEKETIPRFIRSGSFRIDSSVYVRDWHSVNLTETIFYVDIKMK
ncbi:GM22089 [Drosophila sechellia]|uniref:GM22089 n=1 Tax=Drosophila sechellia TaxID=7238 RepID=B4IB22_DROSE|nr:GM22089 [Drosophila sechellia]